MSLESPRLLEIDFEVLINLRIEQENGRIFWEHICIKPVQERGIIEQRNPSNLFQKCIQISDFDKLLIWNFYRQQLLEYWLPIELALHMFREEICELSESHQNWCCWFIIWQFIFKSFVIWRVCVVEFRFNIEVFWIFTEIFFVLRELSLKNECSDICIISLTYSFFDILVSISTCWIWHSENIVQPSTWQIRLVSKFQIEIPVEVPISNLTKLVKSIFKCFHIHTQNRHQIKLNSQKY